jgi:hypothetical protein
MVSGSRAWLAEGNRDPEKIAENNPATAGNPYAE